MENNKMTDEQGKACEKGHCCKHHRCLASALMIIIVLAAFGLGVAVGHKGGRVRGFNQGRFQGRGYETQAFFRGGKAANDQVKNLRFNQAATPATSTATSSVIK